MDGTLILVPAAIKNIARPGRSAIEFGLAFVDPADALRAAHILRHRDESRGDIRLLLESPVLYESVRPFLQALQQLDPIRLPLAAYIKHGNLNQRKIELPEYSLTLGFTWGLKVLLRPDEAVDECVMDPADQYSVASAREVLHAHCKLDPR